MRVFLIAPLIAALIPASSHAARGDSDLRSTTSPTPRPSPIPDDVPRHAVPIHSIEPSRRNRSRRTSSALKHLLGAGRGGCHRPCHEFVRATIPFVSGLCAWLREATGRRKPDDQPDSPCTGRCGRRRSRRSSAAGGSQRRSQSLAPTPTLQTCLQRPYDARSSFASLPSRSDFGVPAKQRTRREQEVIRTLVGGQVKT
jgi:hypothetical protein